MANPQAENGHTDVANEIAEALARINLSGYESRILWVIFRKTYGWHKKQDKIPLSQFQSLTMIRKPHIVRTLNELVRRNIVTRTGNGVITTYRFQKDYTQWDTVTKRGNVTRIGNGVTRIGNESLPGLVTERYPNRDPQKKLQKKLQKKEDQTSFSLSKAKGKTYLPDAALTDEERGERYRQREEAKEKALRDRERLKLEGLD